MKSEKPQWHFKRSELIEEFLIAFEIGSSQSLTLFAPRRMGKTEFILKDLIPEAELRGYKTAYVDFWTHRNDPVLSLKAGLRMALETQSLAERFTARRYRLQEAKVQAGFGSGGPELRFSGSIAAPVAIKQDALEEIGQMLRDLMRGSKPVLLCLDEVQHLATDTAFEPLVFFLRSQLERYKDQLNVVYTGSSRDDLQRLFRRRKAPLFQSTSQLDLPQLGAGFVHHICHAVEVSTGRKLAFYETFQSFKLLNHNPAEFRNVVHALIVEGGEDILGITKEYLSLTDEADIYEELWADLKPLDQAVLLWIAQDSSGLYQTAAKKFIACWVGLPEKDISTSAIQGALRRMRGSLISSVEYGKWEIEDPRFRDWLRAR